jgi:hypothetical protein
MGVEEFFDLVQEDNFLGWISDWPNLKEGFYQGDT